ncbi:MAG: putative Glutamate--tRNA ligase, partial [Streblomastix strix]
MGQFTPNIQFYDNQFFNNSNSNTSFSANDVYLDWFNFPPGWNVANFKDKVKGVFAGSISEKTNSIYIFKPVTTNVDLPKSDFIYFINQESTSGTGSGVDRLNPMKTIQSSIQQQYRNSKLIFNILGYQHNESIIINSLAEWKSIIIDGKEGQETTMSRRNDDINGAIITLTTNSIIPTTILNVKMIVDSSYFVIQQSNKAQLTLSNIEFIGAGRVKQEGLALLLIDKCSFSNVNNIDSQTQFIQAIKGQLEIALCSFGTALEKQLGAPAIQTSSQCSNIKITKTTFFNLHSNITNQEMKTTVVNIEIGEKTNVEFNECIFFHCIDSSSDNSYSSGAVCIQSTNNQIEMDKISTPDLILSQVSFIQCQFAGCIGGQSGAIFASFNSDSVNERLKIIIDECSFVGCGSKYSNVGAFQFIGNDINNNYGDVQIMNSRFTSCIGQQAGGILVGENIKPIKIKNNYFSDNSFKSSIQQGASDIFFQSKELLDSAGGIKCVVTGYKYEEDSQYNIIGLVKINGFSSNFAKYLNCVSRNGEKQCGQIPCGGELNIKPEQCEYIEDEDKYLECQKLCIPEKETEVNDQCPCLYIGDPREACKTISSPTSDTPVTVDNPCLAHNDPREACKTISSPTSDTPVTVDNPCLAYNDPREACKTISSPTSDTPVTVDNPCLAFGDPRYVCQNACVPLADTPINVCGCLEINDPRPQCQKSCVPKANTPINECCCFDIDDPRDECKEKTQSGLDDEKQQDQSEIDKDQVEDKKQGLSALVIALIAIASVSVITTIISIGVIIHFVRKKKNAYLLVSIHQQSYPSYDFACPIIDSKEGVTVALRTIEYRDRNAQYAFMQEALKIRPVPIQDFARLNFLYTEMSKRKLQKFVDDGISSGWNDPRFPTIQGIMRKGMTIPALRAFVLEQGPSKNITYQEWDKIWSKNRQVIDPLAPRYTAIECVNVVHILIVDGPEQPEIKKLAVNKKDPEHGNKDVVFSKDIIIEQCDAQLISDNEEITLMSWGNIIVDKIERDPTKQIVSPLPNASANETVAQIAHIDAHLHLEGDFKKTKLKLTWLSALNLDQLPIAQFMSFDHLLTKGKLEEDEKAESFINRNSIFQCSAYIEPAASTGIEGDIVQFERKGNFYLDKPFETGKDGKQTSGVYHFIPDGRNMLMKIGGRQLISISESQKAEELINQKEIKEAKSKGEQIKEKEKEKETEGKKEKKPKQTQSSSDADSKRKADLDSAFGLCNFRIIKLSNSRKHPEADKLIIADADLGDGITKTLVTGLIPHYQPEDLEGRIVCSISNLKPK